MSVSFEKPGSFAGQEEVEKWHDFGFFQLRVNADRLLEAKFLPERDEIRVLPFVLPPARTYYDLDRTYFSHINLCWGKDRFPIKPQYEVLAKYGFRHPSNILDSRETYQWAKEAGMDMSNILSAPADGPGAWAKPWGGNARDLPDEALPKLDQIFIENWKRKSKDFKDLVKDAVLYPVFTSEQDHWRATKEEPDRPENVYHVYSDMTAFRQGCVHRILTMLELQAARKEVK